MTSAPNPRPQLSGSSPKGLDPGELKRKGLHVSTFVIPLLYLNHAVSRREASFALTLAMAVLIVIELARMQTRSFGGFFRDLFRDQLRSHEASALLGGTYEILGFLLCILAFERPVAVAACEFLVLGDAAAALVGKAIGRYRVFDKTLEGSVACFVVCALVGWALSTYAPGLPLRVALAGALAASVFELLPIPLDDNLKIPLSSGLIMHFLMG